MVLSVVLSEPQNDLQVHWSWHEQMDIDRVENTPEALTRMGIADLCHG
jgi:hypothetical protein